MDSLAKIGYEAFVAYTLPGLVMCAPWLYFAYRSHALPSDAAGITIVIGVAILVAILCGQAIDMAAHVAFATWRQTRKNNVYWNQGATSKLLRALLERKYPLVTQLEDSEYSEVVDSLFSRHVSSHIYSRRNWDYSRHDASRNLLIAFPLCGAGLIFLCASQMMSLSVALFGLIVLGAVGYISAWRYMRWSIEKYYGYSISLTLTVLLEESAGSNQSAT